MKIRKLPDSERPREKLLREGKERLSNTEILAIIIGSGTGGRSALDLASEVISLDSTGIRFLAGCRPEELQRVKGIGRAKAVSYTHLRDSAAGRQGIHETAGTRRAKRLCDKVETRQDHRRRRDTGRCAACNRLAAEMDITISCVLRRYRRFGSAKRKECTAPEQCASAEPAKK